MTSNTSPALGDLIVTTTPIYHQNGDCIPANTVGIVCGRQHNGLIQIDFGEAYGSPKFLSPVWVEVIDIPDTSESLGETLFDLVVKLNQKNLELERENRRLHEQVAFQPRFENKNGYCQN
jgi:hypothetical protein